MTISVCIPTYRRPEMLRQCIESCFANAVRPLEIVVSDDAADPEVQSMVAAIRPPEGVSIIYTPNRLGRGQSANVNCAMQTATRPRLVLMHDDDTFVPGGIDALARGWDEAEGHVDAVYGRQKIVDAQGRQLDEATQDNNRSYHRLLPSGLQPSPLWSALVQQFPNNGYMVARDLALSVGYPSEAEVGREPVDFHFGLRLALAAQKGFWMVPDYVACYRLSAQSVARGASRRQAARGDLGFTALLQARDQVQREFPAFQHALDHYAAAAITGYLEQRNGRQAAQVLRDYPNMPISRAGRLRLTLSITLMRLGLPRFSDRVRLWRV